MNLQAWLDENCKQLLPAELLLRAFARDLLLEAAKRVCWTCQSGASPELAHDAKEVGDRNWYHNSGSREKPAYKRCYGNHVLLLLTELEVEEGK